MDKGQQLLEVNRKIKQTSSSLYRYQLEKESLKLQEEIGLENKRIIAKELGCGVRQIYKHIHKECNY